MIMLMNVKEMKMMKVMMCEYEYLYETMLKRIIMIHSFCYF